MKCHADHSSHGTRNILTNGFLATGVHLSKRAVQAVASRPVLLAGIGVLAGVYFYKKLNKSGSN